MIMRADSMIYIIYNYWILLKYDMRINETTDP